MSSPRGLANHHLYLARLVLAAWQRDSSAGVVPASTLAAAFGSGCHQHLLRAYGWFLLAVSAPGELPAAPPTRVADLAPPPEGKAVAGEIREFEQLERSGWLADMLGWECPAPGATRRSPGNLASTVEQATGPGEFAGWVDSLESRFARMADSMDEY
ncbi:hypothetical protein FV139_13560 [Parahaliea maris]|uniref:PasA protein n=1 Tax=Parahaliea maris TaxID=2716870 RepID=A0A5C8ZWX6_9GAMM|nr:DUF6586 family protein [Parahaliea maris]TXS92976.1 hypothetical protein FV139_13560 [Parahaliea maris]